MSVKVTAPTRIDLAGGTLDIFPLYIFESGGLTVNMAIDLNTSAEIKVREDKQLNIFSRDLNVDFHSNNITDVKPVGELELVIRAVRFFAPSFGLDIVTESNVPKGSGLAASSSLLIALMYGLSYLCNEQTNSNTFIDWCANVEARSLGIPTGKQDYYAAYFGGLSKILFEDKGITHEHAGVSSEFLEELQQSIILSFTGVSHFSGTNNWNMLKSYIDNKGRTRECLKAIKQTSIDMWAAVNNCDIKTIAKMLGTEWENRKKLAAGVTTPGINKIIASAKKAGALASKICGAGGGGCLVTIAERQNRKKVVSALQSAGAEILDFNVSTSGVVLKKTGTVK